jgi:hypothetical protein
VTENVVQVKFGADTAGFDAGAAEAKEEMANVGASVRSLVDLFLILGGAATGSFREMRAGAAEAGRQIKETAESVREFREAISGIGEALIAAFAVEQITEFAKRMGETAEATYHTALTFGETTSEVQAFNAQMKALGIAPDAAVTSFGRLDRALTNARDGNKQMAETFKGLGVNIAEPMSQTELFEKTIQGLSKVQDVPTRIGDAMRLLGRNIQGIAPLLGLTTAQIEEAKKVTEEYGASNDQATARGLALAESFNTNKVAMQGLNNVLTDALAPAFKVLVDGVNGLIKSFIDSYRQGGLVKGLCDALTAALQILVTVVATAWSGFQQFFEFLEAGWYNIVAIASAAGIVLYDAMTGNGGKAAADGEAAFTRWHNKAVEALADVAKEGDKWRAYMKEVWSPPKTPELPKAAKVPDEVNVKPGKPKGQTTGMDDLREQLEKRVNEHNDSIEDMTAVELKFWQDVQNGAITANKALDPKEWAEVRRNVLRLTHQEAMVQLRDEMAQAKDTASSQGAAFKDAAADRKAQLEQQVAEVEDADKNRLIGHRQAGAQIIALYRQEQAAAVQAANQVYAARVQADDFIMAHSARATSEYKAAQKDEVAAAAERNRAIVTANDNAARQMSQQNRRTLDEMRQQWHGYVNGTVQAMGQGIKGMITGTMTFGQAMARIGESILDVFLNIGERMVENWIVNLIVAQTQQAVTGVAQVTSNAAVAASGAYAATAMIPFVGPELAPAAAMTAFAGAIAFAPLASAARGYDIPAGVNPLTQLHEQEMVLPATLANPLRAMLSGANDNTGQDGGDSHLHYHDHSTITGGGIGDIVSAMASQKRDVLRLFGGWARGGHFSPVFKAAGMRP